MKYIVKGAIRVVVEADSPKEAQRLLCDELKMIANNGDIGDWDEIDIDDAVEAPEDFW